MALKRLEWQMATKRALSLGLTQRTLERLPSIQ
jgi:hypothetical protein